MDLDERVQRLEEDLSILKNQVRNTLLDIQDQLASLCALGEGGASENRAPLSRDRDNSSRSGPNGSDRGSSHAREQSRNPGETSLPSPSETGTKSTADDLRPSLETYAALVRWADASVPRIGRQRTREILDTSEAEGRVSKQMKESVVRLALLDAAEEERHDVDTSDVLAAITSLNRALGEIPSTAQQHVLAESTEAHGG